MLSFLSWFYTVNSLCMCFLLPNDIKKDSFIFSFMISEVQLPQYNFSELFWSEPQGRKIAMWFWVKIEDHMHCKDAALVLRVAVTSIGWPFLTIAVTQRATTLIVPLHATFIIGEIFPNDPQIIAALLNPHSVPWTPSHKYPVMESCVWNKFKLHIV